MLGLVYLFGSPIHVYFSFNAPAYHDFSEWAPPITELSREVWTWFLSNAQVLALLLAMFELLVSVLILWGGQATRLGLIGALGFHLILASMFGMWPYTVPMVFLIGWSLRYDFERAFIRRRLANGGRTDDSE